MPKFSNRIFGSNVDQTIINIFNNLQKGSFDIAPLDEAKPTHQDYLGDRTTFARMWTSTLLVSYDKEEMEIHLDTLIKEGKKTKIKSLEEKIIYHIVNDNNTEEKSYETNKSISDEVSMELSKNVFLKPTSGITSITTKTEGALGAIKRTTVDFVVHNKNDFEDIFLPFFLKPGSTVVVDYGWSDPLVDLYSVKGVIENNDIHLDTFKNYIYGGAETGPNGEFIHKNSEGEYYYYPIGTSKAKITEPPREFSGFINDNAGLVDVIIGRVTSYKSSVNAQGSFECSVELVSENTSLLDAEITDQNNLKFIFANKLEEILINLIAGESSLTDDVRRQYLYNKLDVGEKREAHESFYGSLGIRGEKAKGTIISDLALKNGLFYQNITSISDSPGNKNEVLYMSYGLFEDLFLNGLISENQTDDRFAVNFNTKDTFVRYDDNLLARQKAILGRDEALPLFLYPESWEETYNGKTPKEVVEEHKSTKNEFKTPIIPFREVFISIPLISKTFSTKQNINDALESIIEKLNQDSFGVFKLKMISLNKSFSSVSFQDFNLIPEVLPNILTFDITSHKSIVSNLNYDFEMPKGGLSSMIAIGDKEDYEFFDDINKDDLSFLKILGPDKEIHGATSFFKNLPLKKIPPTEEEEDSNKKSSTYDFSRKSIKKIVPRLQLNMENPAEEFTSIIENIYASKERPEGEDDSGTGTEDEKKKSEGRKKNDNLVPTRTVRQYYGTQARLNTVLNNSLTSVSPLLPVTVEPTIYGNTYLNVGDIFTVNFLPTHYLENIFFQIIGIEHKIGSNWETSYSTVMRLRPDRKGNIIRSNLKKPVMDDVYTNEVLNKDGNAGNIGNAAVGSRPVADVPDGTVVNEVDLDYDDVTKATDKVENKTNNNANGDSRAAKIEFLSPPQKKADVVLILGFQRTIVDYIKDGALSGVQTVAWLTEDINKISLGEGLTGSSNMNTTDLQMRGLVEDKGGFRNALLKYFGNAGFNYWPNVESFLKQHVAGHEPTKKYLYDIVKKSWEEAGPIDTAGTSWLDQKRGIGTREGKEFDGFQSIVMGNAISEMDDDFGIIIPVYIFKAGDFPYTGPIIDNKGPKNVSAVQGTTSKLYTIDFDPGASEGFAPTIRIPEWFITTNNYSGIKQFASKLVENYDNLMSEFKMPGESIPTRTSKSALSIRDAAGNVAKE